MRTDEQLMLEFKEGSAPAFEELFERYRNPLYGFFRRRMTSRARAEETAQETFFVVLRDAGNYQPTAKFRTYLYAIALKLLWTARRKDQRDTAFANEPAEVQSGGDPATVLSVQSALATMDPDYREVLMLREYEQLSYEEIAVTLDIPANTVRSRLFRARAELRARMEPQEQIVKEASQ